MKHLVCFALIAFSVVSIAAQGWLPSIRSTEKSGIRFWQKNMPPVVLKDRIPDSTLGYRLYGIDTTTVLGRFNPRSSDGEIASVFFADFDGNGFNDCVALDVLYLNVSTPLEISKSIPKIIRPAGLADVDGDGTTDVCDGVSIHYGPGDQILTLKKTLAHSDPETRPDYRINYLDTLGGKIVFLTSWGHTRGINGSFITLALEELPVGSLQSTGDTVRLRTLRTYTYSSPSGSLGSVRIFRFDNVWFITAKIDDEMNSVVAVTIDTLYKVEHDPTFTSYQGIQVWASQYRANSDARGHIVVIVDCTIPCLVERFDQADSSNYLRYVSVQAQPPLFVQTLAELNVSLTPDGSSLATNSAVTIPDADGDGFEEVLNAWQLIANDKIYSSDIYLTSGNITSNVIAELDPQTLPTAIQTTGGWTMRDASSCPPELTLTKARIYGTDGRLIAMADMFHRGDGYFLQRPPALPVQGIKIAVFGKCVVRLP